MMREILFIGKRIDNGEWILGGFHSRDGKAYIIGISKRGIIDGIEVDPLTVGQYTGLTDKNGERIFEGYKCKVTRHCILCYGSITFKKGSFWFKEFNTDRVLELSKLKINNFEIEVIGNIHDDPELLKECAE